MTQPGCEPTTYRREADTLTSKHTLPVIWSKFIIDKDRQTPTQTYKITTSHIAILQITKHSNLNMI